MTDKLLCPFCQQELEEETFARGRVFVSCNNPNCTITDWGGCSKQIITALIDTKKELDVVIGAIKKADHHIRICHYVQARTDLRQALEQINEIIGANKM